MVVSICRSMDVFVTLGVCVCTCDCVIFGFLFLYIMLVWWGTVMMWLSVWSQVQTCIWSSWCHCHSLSLAPVKSRLVLPFWYRLTQVVLEKRPLNGCSCWLYIMLVRLHFVQNKLNMKGFTVTGCNLTCCGKICNAESQISSQFIVRLLEGASNTSVIHAAILIELDLQQTHVRWTVVQGLNVKSCSKFMTHRMLLKNSPVF